MLTLSQRKTRNKIRSRDRSVIKIRSNKYISHKLPQRLRAAAPMASKKKGVGRRKVKSLQGVTMSRGSSGEMIVVTAAAAAVEGASSAAATAALLEDVVGKGGPENMRGAEAEAGAAEAGEEKDAGAGVGSGGV
mmetsp:Transcript_32791/g.57887  ORF Transcript_32791/g.57887 Transcript_32791/m.57887 type:complete len:134 (+) Transcript_32791:211-612(+)